MAGSLKIPKTIILPDLEKIEDPEVKKALGEHNRVLSELVTTLYSDISWLHERIDELEKL